MNKLQACAEDYVCALAGDIHLQESTAQLDDYGETKQPSPPRKGGSLGEKQSANPQGRVQSSVVLPNPRLHLLNTESDRSSCNPGDSNSCSSSEDHQKVVLK